LFMRIAIVHNLPAGGQKRALYEQVKRLAKKHTLDLFTLSSTNESFLPLKPLVRSHYTVSYQPASHFPGSIVSIYQKLPKAYQELAEKINQGSYDIAYVNPCYLTQAPYILRFLTIPSVYYCPEPKREFYESIPRITNKFTYNLTLPFRLPIKNIDYGSARRADIILTNSNYSRARIQNIYQKKAFINYLGVDGAVFKPQTKAKENLVLTVGELSLHKGHDFLLKAISLIPKKSRPQFIIVGPSGSETEYLIKLAKDLKVNLRILNNISDTQLVDWYNKAKVFLYAACFEPFGLSVLEALSCGTFVLGVNEGGVSEIINNNHLGNLLPRDEKVFSERIKLLLCKQDSQQDRQRRHIFTKKNWNWEKSVSLLETYFNEKYLYSYTKL